MFLKKLAKMFITILIFTLLVTSNGCSNATLRNSYQKEGPVSEFQGEGNYYHSRIIITTPDTPLVVNGEPVIEAGRIVEEDNSFSPFWEQPSCRNCPSRDIH